MILVTTPGDVRTRGHAAAGSRSCSPATRTRSPGCGPEAEIAALTDPRELRLDISERGLPSDTAAIHERAEAGDLRGRVVHHSLSDVAWVLNAHALFFGALLVPAGSATNMGARSDHRLSDSRPTRKAQRDGQCLTQQRPPGRSPSSS